MGEIDRRRIGRPHKPGHFSRLVKLHDWPPGFVPTPDPPKQPVPPPHNRGPQHAWPGAKVQVAATKARIR